MPMSSAERVEQATFVSDDEMLHASACKSGTNYFLTLKFPSLSV